MVALELRLLGRPIHALMSAANRVGYAGEKVTRRRLGPTCVSNGNPVRRSNTMTEAQKAYLEVTFDTLDKLEGTLHAHDERSAGHAVALQQIHRSLVVLQDTMVEQAAEAAAEKRVHAGQTVGRGVGAYVHGHGHTHGSGSEETKSPSRSNVKAHAASPRVAVAGVSEGRGSRGAGAGTVDTAGDSDGNGEVDEEEMDEGELAREMELLQGRINMKMDGKDLTTMAKKVLGRRALVKLISEKSDGDAKDAEETSNGNGDSGTGAGQLIKNLDVISGRRSRKSSGAFLQAAINNVGKKGAQELHTVTAQEGSGVEMHLWIARANEAFKVGFRRSIEKTST